MSKGFDLDLTIEGTGGSGEEPRITLTRNKLCTLTPACYTTPLEGCYITVSCEVDECDPTQVCAR